MPIIRKGSSVGKQILARAHQSGPSSEEWQSSGIDKRLPAKDAWTASEHALQARVIGITRKVAPHFPERSKSEAGRLKAEGVTQGVPDLFLSVPRHGKHGFYLELKKARGTPSANQKTFLIAAQAKGYQCGVFNDLESILSALGQYLEIPLSKQN